MFGLFILTQGPGVFTTLLTTELFSNMNPFNNHNKHNVYRLYPWPRFRSGAGKLNDEFNKEDRPDLSVIEM